MSLFLTETARCPACAHEVEFNVVYSVNADRRPDLRAAILKGTFQRQACPECGKTFRLEPEMAYLDVGRKQWLLVQPIDKLAQWPALDLQARMTFEEAYGQKASAPARAIGRTLTARVTFGWAALREKLLCAEHGLNDVTLELLKMAMVRGLEDAPLGDDTELRLVNLEGDVLVLAWIKAAAEQLVETLRVPKLLYDDIAADTKSWQALRAELTAGPFVDVHRILVEAA